MPNTSVYWMWVRDNAPDLIGALDFVLGVVGFVFVIVEIRRTKKAAFAAKEASDHTTWLLSHRLTILNIGLVHGYLSEVRTALWGERWETASIRTEQATTGLRELKTWKGFGSNTRRSEIQTMVTLLARLQNALEWKQSNRNHPFTVPEATQTLTELIGQLSEWSAEETLAPRDEGS